MTVSLPSPSFPIPESSSHLSLFPHSGLHSQSHTCAPNPNSPWAPHAISVCLTSAPCPSLFCPASPSSPLAPQQLNRSPSLSLPDGSHSQSPCPASPSITPQILIQSVLLPSTGLQCSPHFLPQLPVLLSLNPTDSLSFCHPFSSRIGFLCQSTPFSPPPPTGPAVAPFAFKSGSFLLPICTWRVFETTGETGCLLSVQVPRPNMACSSPS